MTLFKEDYYTAIRPYIPEDAKAVLETQVPEIQKKVAGEIKEFADSFAAEIAKEAEKELQAALAEMATLRTAIAATTSQLAAANIPPATLAAETAKLQQQLADYNARFVGWGETLRKATLTALKATAAASGLSLPAALPTLLTTVIGKA